jgi:DNA-binding transcriptional regulator YiaG
MTQILAHVRGEVELKSYTLPVPIDVKAIRKKLRMSQSEFASAFALNRRTIGRNPEAVVEALRS